MITVKHEWVTNLLTALYEGGLIQGSQYFGGGENLALSGLTWTTRGQELCLRDIITGDILHYPTPEAWAAQYVQVTIVVFGLEYARTRFGG